jgi:diguanylate cyclase (GGDEF)-like protein
MIPGQSRPVPAIMLDPAALDLLMPLHLRFGADGTILHAGPTLRRLAALGPLEGDGFLQRFEVLRPSVGASVEGLLSRPGTRLKLRLRQEPEIAFRGLSLPWSAGEGVLVNLSLGIAVVEAVRRFGLTNDDFATTDLAIEMLYLIEAKSAVLDELRSLNDRLRHARALAEEQAFTDTLTGLANRRALEGVLEDLIASGRPFGLMRIDLDFFKEVNDRFGHAAGDHVLEATARVLRDEVREGDTVARVGGDEFVVILRDETDSLRLEGIALRLVARLSKPIAFGTTACRISASIGTTLSTFYTPPEADILLRDADAALYISKREGRSRATLVSPDLIAAGRLSQVLGDAPE